MQNLHIYNKVNSLKAFKFIKVFALIFATFFLASCFVDANANKKLVFVEANKSFNLSSAEKLTLKFNKNLAIDSVNKTNIKLKSDDGTLVEADDYTISYDGKQIKVGLVNEGLKSATKNYTLTLNNIKDAYGKQLDAMNIKVVFTDSEPPYLVNYNLGDASQINANFKLSMNFSESLQFEQGIKQSFILLDSSENSAIEKSNYKVTAKNNNKTFTLELTNNRVKKVSGDYKLIFAGISDASGNKLNDDGLSFRFLSNTPGKLESANLAGEFLYPLETESLILNFDKALDETSFSALKFSVAANNNDFNEIDNNKMQVEFVGNAKKSLKINKIATFDEGKFKAGLTYKIDFSQLQDKDWNKIAGKNSVTFKKLDTNTTNLIFVTKDGASANDGKSWATAKDIKSALETTASNPVFFVAEGEYELNNNLKLTEGFKLYGGFNPNANTKARNLEGSILKPKAGKNIQASKSGSPTTSKDATLIDGFLIQDGLSGNNNLNGTVGSGILYIKNFNMTLNNISFKNNVGQIEIDAESDIYVNNSTFANNYRAFKLSNAKSKLSINNSIFLNNTNADSGGGAIGISYGKLLIKNSKFIQNSSKNGGAIHSSVPFKDTNIQIENSIFQANEAKSADGGAIYAANNLVVKNSLFLQNKAKNRGGSLYTIANANFTQKVNIVNSAFYKNEAEFGGALFADKATGVFKIPEFYLVNSLFVENQAQKAGGALFNYIFEKNMKIYNSIFWNNKNKLAQTETINNIYNYRLAKPFIKNSILNKASVLIMIKNEIYTYLEAKTLDFMALDAQFKDNKTSDPLLRIYAEELEAANIKRNEVMATFKSDFIKLEKNTPAKNLADKNLYLELLKRLNASLTKIPTDEKDLAGNPRLTNNQLDAGVFQSRD